MFQTITIHHRWLLLPSYQQRCRPQTVIRCHSGYIFGKVEDQHKIVGQGRVIGKNSAGKEHFVKINSMLVKIAQSALEDIKNCGEDQIELTKFACRMIQRYEKLLQKSDVNLVNCVTMLHRLGMLFGAVSPNDKLFEASKETLKELVWLIGKHVHDLDPRQISNVIWAFGKIGRNAFTLKKSEISVPMLYTGLFEHALKFDCFKVQEISSFLVGLANMGFQIETCQVVLDHMICLASDQAYLLKSREIANIIWALATLEYCPASTIFFSQAMDQAVIQLRSFTPQQITNLLWGLAKLDLDRIAGPVLSYFENDFVMSMDAYKHRGTPLVVWSFAKLHFLPKKGTLDKAIWVVSKNLSKASAQSISNLIYALAIFRYTPSRDFIKSLKIHFLEQKDKFSAQLICMFIWSLAVLFQLDSLTASVAFAEIEDRNWRKELSHAEERQIFQCILHLQTFVPNGSKSITMLSQELLEECKEAWEQGQNSKWVYSVSLSVLMTLQQMGHVAQHKYVASTGQTHLLIDTILQAKNAQHITVDVTIRSHVFQNHPKQIEGPRIWMLKLLKSSGFQILQIDASKWKECSKVKRIKLLKQRLRELDG